MFLCGFLFTTVLPSFYKYLLVLILLIYCDADNPLFRVGCGICHPCGLVYHPPFSYLGGHYEYRTLSSSNLITCY